MLPHACVLQIKGATAMGMPVVVTEQYPKALGRTVPSLKKVRSTGGLAQVAQTCSRAHAQSKDRALNS